MTSASSRHGRHSPSFLACCASTIAVLVAIFAAPNFVGDLSPIQHDQKSYYGYLPALFIHHDIRLDYYAADPAAQMPFIEAETTRDGHYFLKMTCGVAIFQLPFFLIAHGYSLLVGDPTGYTAPYKLMMILSNAFYGCAALFILRGLLRRYVSDSVAAWVIITLMLGTNLFWYTYFEAGLSHVLLFFDFAMVLWLTIRWHERATAGTSLALGIFCGMALLTRPTDGLIVLFPILFGVYSRDSLREKVTLVEANLARVILACVALLLPSVLQMLYWHTATGQWLFYSYGDEQIHLLKPHLIEGLFGFRKGFFIYTPVMILSVIGIGFSSQKLRPLFYPMIVFLVLNVYLVLCWWCWWYGGSFGMRPLVESYAILAFPLAVFYETAFANRRWRGLLVSAILAAIALNQFQTYQYRHNIIDFERMTPRAYWYVFLKPSLTDAERAELRTLLDHIDYTKAMNGD